MKNKLIIDNDESKEEYRILIKVDTKDKEYLIYTRDEENSCGDIICYAGIYERIGGIQQLRPIEDTNTLEYLDGILMQVQNKMNKKKDSD